LNQHQRAVLQARKQHGSHDGRSNTSSPAAHPQQRNQPSPPGHSRPVPPRKDVSTGSGSGSFSNGNGNGKGKATHLDPYDRAAATTVAGPSRSATATPRHHHDTDDDEDGQDPFRDPPTQHASSSRQAGSGNDSPPRLSYEPFHPGFGGGGGASSSSAAGPADKGKKQQPHVAEVSDDDDYESDAYRATPKKDEGGRSYLY
jgi:hypothetical protein